MRKKNILVAQGGGPTMVINQSLVGVIEAAKTNNFNVYGALNGVNGILNSKIISLSKLNSEKLSRVAITPSSILGSTRDKPDEKYCEEIFKVLKKRQIDKFFYIGGNDSSDTLRIISNKASLKNYQLQCVHIPKTIDNDLVLNDHTPGFGSAAKYVASAFAGVSLDVSSLPGVYIGVVMGRHAGFLTAASGLLKEKDSEGPHLIYTPESVFKITKFLQDVKNVHLKFGKCVIAVSEGVHDENKKLIAHYNLDHVEKDAHGNLQLSGISSLGDYLVKQIKENLNIKRVRADTFGYLQRSFLGSVSEIDSKEARILGKKSVLYSLKIRNSFSICIEERKKFVSPYKIFFGINKLEDVGGKTKLMPKSFINKNQNFVTNQFIKYARPLIGNKIPKFISSI
tara:strand:+ start:298 stop:1488 length:1191 start_codon:yes stop_codon:yes gene_type:complete